VKPLADWLREIGLEKYAAAFAENDVDFDVIQSLTDADLETLGLSLGHRRRLQQALAAFDRGGATPKASDAPQLESLPLPQPAAGAPVPGERRQLTVMFCDLADSTALAARLDPEQFREIVRAYQTICAQAVSRFDGHIAQYLGDGVLIYFGHPRAHEDDAQRAVRAALDLPSAMRELNTHHAAMLGGRLSVRIGIHTGLVVVGGMGERQEQLALGEAPNVAARLQALASADGAVISAATKRLVEGIFALRELGTVELKGLPDPVQAYEVLGQTEARSRLEAFPHSTLTPLVSRDLEVGLLLDRWEKACDGQGQVVLLSGEPGIGKSRLVQVLKERLQGQDHLRVEHRCSPYYQNTPFYPVTDTLQRAFEWAREDPDAIKLIKLEATLARFGMENPESAGLLAALMSVPSGERFPMPVMSPERQRQRTLETLLHWALRMADRQPVLYVVEDLHWVDPSTLELLTLVVNQAPGVRMTVLLTARPGFEAPWPSRSHMTLVSLGRLTRRQAEQLVARAAGGKALPAEVVEHIASRADGVPLFLEELTRMLLESGKLRDTGDRYELDSPLPASAIPSTLQDSLTARLDRVGKAKETAQLAATLGRTFEFELLQAVAGTGTDELATRLVELVDADILVQRGLPPKASYSFKHSLIQGAAYQSLLKSVRQEFHRRTAETIARQFPSEAETQPELLAHHLQEAGDALGAAAQWLRAGERAMVRSAYAEAMAHLGAGLATVVQAEQDRARDRLEAQLQIALGTVYFSSLFYTAPEVGRCFSRAYELCNGLADRKLLADAIGGIWLYRLVQGELDAAKEASQEFRQVVSGTVMEPYADLGLACTEFWLGDFQAARQHSVKALDALARTENAPPPVWVGHHVTTTATVWLSMTLWALGLPDQGVTAGRESVTMASDARHLYSESFARMHLAFLQNLRREHRQAQATAADCIKLASEQGHRNWALLASIHEAQALAAQGRRREAIPLQRERINALAMAGDGVGVPHFQSHLAESLADEGQFTEALRLVDDSITRSHRNSGHWCASQMRTIKADIVLKMPNPDTRQAEALYLEAIDIARKQEAKSFELRATLSLARLWQRNGKPNEARELLQGIYGWFTEGFDTPDLKDAKALLESLRHR
jgi:class 3 adenylate cyclase/predicted ATPase